MVAYKQRCALCKNKWALVTSQRQKFVTCMDCEMKVVEKEVEDKEFKKLFKIPIEWYKENSFLRSIRYQYGRWGSLTEKQIEAFKKTVKEKKEKGKEKKKIKKK
jgi:hypothetical protein